MKVPFSWLKQYVDIDVTAQELEDKLFGCGFEVEELIDLGGEISKVVVGVVTECVPQEGTHLHICKVDCGEYGHDIQISTGAPNVYAGMHTAAALDGSTLPGGVKITKGKLRGVPSNGMMCSFQELGLSHGCVPYACENGILFLPAGTPVGEDIKKVEAQLVKLTGKPVDLKIVEVRDTDTNAQLVAENIAQQLEKRIGFRRAMKNAMGRAMRAGAKGIKVNCSGRLGGREIAGSEHYHEGTIPLQTLRADIDYGFAEANTTYGKVGVKVWIYKGEILKGAKAPAKKEGGKQ